MKVFLFAGFTTMLNALPGYNARTARHLTGALLTEMDGEDHGIPALQWLATDTGLEIAYFGDLALVSVTDGKVRAYLAIGNHADMAEWVRDNEFRINPATGAAEVINRRKLAEALAA